MIKTGTYVLVISAIMLEVQYAARLTPEITYICFSCYSRSLMMYEMMTQGIRASAIDTSPAKSRA